MPVRKGLFPARGGLTAYRRLDYGRLLRTHVLDTRTNRSDQVCNDGKIRPCPPDLLQSPEVLGRAQEAWLAQGLGHAAVWNLLAPHILLLPVDFPPSHRSEEPPLGQGFFN